MTQTAEKGGGRRTWLLLLLIFVVLPLAVIGAFLGFGLAPRELGEPFVCERSFDGIGTGRLEVQPAEAGGRYFEEQFFTFRGEGDEEFREVLTLRPPTPRGDLSCEANMLATEDDSLLFWAEEALAISEDAGLTWQLWAVCDDPRPEFGCREAEYIQSIDFAGVDELAVSVFAPEGNYAVVSADGGRTWELRAD